MDLPLVLARVLSPATVLLALFSLFFVNPPPIPSPTPIVSVVVSNTIPRRAPILVLLSLVALTYLGDGLSFVILAVIDKEWPSHSAIPINTVAGALAFAGLAAYGAWKDVQGVQVWTLKRIRLAISASLALDVTLAIFLALRLRSGAQTPPHVPETSPVTVRSIAHIIFPALRVLLLCPLLATLSSPRVVYNPVPQYDDIEDHQPSDSSFLLPQPHASTGLSSSFRGVTRDPSKYGTFNTTRSSLHPSAPATRPATPTPSTGPDSKRSEPKPEVNPDPSWSEVITRIRRLTPYLWPKKSPWLQFLAGLCVLTLLVGRFINVLLPFVLGSFIDVLEGHSTASPWTLLLLFVFLRFLQGSGGLSTLRDTFWAPVLQYSDREMSQLSFDHVLNLSFAWHLRRKTGEVLRILDRGVAVNRILELVLFNVAPAFIDILIGLALFAIYFRWELSLVIFVVMFAYIYASVVLTRQRTRLRRQMNDRDVVTRGIHTDCLLNYETVKYFGGEEHESRRYAEAVREYQALEYKVMLYMNLLNLVQSLIMNVGFLVAALIVAHDVTTDPRPKASKFIVFITYFGQLYAPLAQLAYLYRSLNTALIDTEKLLNLLNEPTEVHDKPNAPDLIMDAGEIEFDNVNFSYDNRTTAIQNVSFKVPRGSSVALVGESGSGKSTILRLLYRFYDLKEGEGRILIDGQDIRDVTQKSLRQAIGVVPQDSILFNASIGYNIGYGKFGATPEEIEAAARSAQMHERIMSFPDGYETKVGERGVRLSGGEKQRVSIARTLLKNPPILLLDEATSALDTSTEKDIQKALQNLMKGRSSLSIAHRLSTIANADVIIVLKEGQIVEQGNFKELIALDGVFASMWADQASSGDDHAPSVAGTSVKKEISGYSAAPSTESLHVAEQPQEDFPVPEVVEVVEDDLRRTSTGEVIIPTHPEPEEQDKPAEPSTISFPTSPHDLAPDEREPSPEMTINTSSPLTEEPEPHVLSPVIESPLPGPAPVSFPSAIAFPGADDPEPEPKPATPIPVVSSPGVSFDPSVNSPPSRTDTPDPDSEPKRKRISSQNFQRLARRISLTTRRQGSSGSIIPSIPGLKRDSSPRVSVDEGSRAEGSSSRASTDTPADAAKADDKGKLKKKEKKEKSRKGTL